LLGQNIELEEKVIFIITQNISSCYVIFNFKLKLPFFF